MTKRLLVGVLAGLAALTAVATAGAEPATPVRPPPPAPAAAAPPAAGSTDDELADMVLDAIQHRESAPATTPVTVPPR